MRVEEAREIYLSTQRDDEIEKMESEITQMALSGYRSTTPHKDISISTIRYFQNNDFRIARDDKGYRIRW